MQCNSEKFQPGQIEILTENREGINATLCLGMLQLHCVSLRYSMLLFNIYLFNKIEYLKKLV